MHPRRRFAFSRGFAFLLGALVVAGCAGPQVRSLGNGDGPAAYELRGSRWVEVEAQATTLCPTGYQLLRHAQRFAQAQPQDNAATQWLQRSANWLSGMPGNEAQATIVCSG
jgi:hypothetical protein